MRLVDGNVRLRRGGSSTGLPEIESHIVNAAIELNWVRAWWREGPQELRWLIAALKIDQIISSGDRMIPWETGDRAREIGYPLRLRLARALDMGTR